MCGFMNVPVTRDECPADPDIPKNCKQAACNELCEGDGECGTRTGENNCGPFDVYRKWTLDGDDEYVVEVEPVPLDA